MKILSQELFRQVYTITLPDIPLSKTIKSPKFHPPHQSHSSTHKHVEILGFLKLQADLLGNASITHTRTPNLCLMLFTNWMNILATYPMSKQLSISFEDIFEISDVTLKLSG